MGRQSERGQSGLPIESLKPELRLQLEEARQAEILYRLLVHADAVNGLAEEPGRHSPLFASARTIAVALRQFERYWLRRIALVHVEVSPTKVALGFGKAHAEVEWTLTWESFRKVEGTLPDSSPDKGNQE